MCLFSLPKPFDVRDGNGSYVYFRCIFNVTEDSDAGNGNLFATSAEEIHPLISIRVRSRFTVLFVVALKVVFLYSK